MAKTGRPPKFTPALGDLIVTLIEGGVPRDHAARAAGIAPSTFYKWLAAGRNETDIDPTAHTAAELRQIAADRNVDITGARRKADIAANLNAAQTPFSEFAERVDQAASRFLASAIGKMREAGDGDWRMWDRLLERRFPELRLGYNPDAADAAANTDDMVGTEEDAQRALERGTDIRVKMLEARTG
jgi:hypothetical protein